MLACDDIMPIGWTPAAASSTLEEWTRTFSRGQQCIQAMTIAKRQMLRSNTRIPAGVADDLIHTAAGEIWELARTGTRARTPPQPMEIPTSNRFQALDDELAEDQIVTS